ncbi:MAG: Alpha-1,4-glucan:maltose-1-phosphate maltosyltransferase 2 [Luteibacter sp.]|uniref:maltotransferase domain-containing protein n=1 Tax=Luteibacter sp. TaxID=1886636 RepID=UPI0013813267|nr:maltotransferase domain-containing protein [Luteibacter sp.]KAF1006461.1 MAG: Alpha-1,4-glucan:maltose-1-phosphate maltosyltransferase 2 [Luteibacter sp.]
MSASMRAPLRIYYLHPRLAGPLTAWNAWIDHAAGLGFAQLLVAPPFEASSCGNVFVTRDVERLDPAIADGDAETRLGQIAKACRAKKLEFWLDLPLDELASDAPLRHEHPEWFRAVAAQHGTPDPRWTPSESESVRWRLNDLDVAGAATQWWIDRLRRWVAAGVTGFRLLHPQRLSAHLWKTLIDAVRHEAPGIAFLAWTPGCTPDQVAAMRGVGFDATVSSANWWDYRAPWFAEETTRLAAIAPSLACAEEPFGTRLGDELGEENQLDHAYRRAAAFAATSPAGWLVPMGFEFAVHDALDARRGEPMDPTTLKAKGLLDLRDTIQAANASVAPQIAPAPHIATHGDVALLLTVDGADARTAKQATLTLVNASLDRDVPVASADILTGAASHFGPWTTPDGHRLFEHDDGLLLAPGAVLTLSATPSIPALRKMGASVKKELLQNATRAPRVAIEAVQPTVDGGRFPAKRIVGEPIVVTADIFLDGHDVLAARLCYRAQDEKGWHDVPMSLVNNDIYTASFTPTRIGRHEFRIEAWRDPFASYHHELEVKHAAGVPVALELEEGRLLVEKRANGASGARAKALRNLATAVGKANDEARVSLLLADAAADLMSATDPRDRSTVTDTFVIEVDRREAMFASWYELFPRSMTESKAHHGTFRNTIGRLPAIRDMGFDVLYFPPIHPIGKAFRKGPNNTLTPGPDDPGSPYAIGSPDGGHTAIHPQLGTLEDFRALRDAAHEHGLELALDFAIQCSPDHPWLKEHPEWFDWRPDGSIKYAENPPKKYQDIVNVDFYADGAVPSLWQALCDAVLFWAEEGVRTFRVDNPHTKPFPFWEWMIARVRAKYPDALFLSEAFTRPKPMYRLAKVGFSQSYTYFTWRNSKQEFIDYLTELTTTPPKDFFRPNFFVNTPDINPYFLQTSGRPGFLIRAALATTLSGLWGMYSGFEICESAPMPGKEEYLDSEKYEIRIRDFDAPGNIVAEITQLNRIRRAHPALQTHHGVRFLPANNDQVLFFEKRRGDDLVLVAISMDPHNAQAADLTLPLGEWGLPDDASLDVHDLLHPQPIAWRGPAQHVWLGLGQPYAIWHVRLPGV